MEKLIINGGRNLNGGIDIVSAKNAILPILAGSIICEDKVVIHKCTKFTDVLAMIKILESLGIKANYEEDTLVLDCSTVNKYEVKEEYSKQVRSSIFVLGALLSRLKKARVAYPGGCQIGHRSVGMHLKGLRGLNVHIEERHGYIFCDGENMKSGEIYLDFPSVGATENLIMASIKLKGRTIIHNCAREPEICDLQDFLNAMGAKISGAGSDTIEIIGVEKLNSVEYTPISDRIIAGTYLIATAICGGKVKFDKMRKEHNNDLLNKLRESGVIIKEDKDSLILESKKILKSIPAISTQPYPGFPTDLQNQLLVMETISQGTSIIIENLFENRFKICQELTKMGADIKISDRTAIIQGVKNLSGATVEASDLRCGAGLVLAGLVADGYTTIENIYHIDRGYLSIEDDFCKLGAEIKRINI